MTTIHDPRVRARVVGGWLDLATGELVTELPDDPDDPVEVGDWQDAYDIARTTGSRTEVDAWYDANCGRDSGDSLLDLGGQVTVTTSWLNANLGNGHVFLEGGVWIIENVQCANLRISGANNVLIRQCYLPRGEFSYLYAIHCPNSAPTFGHNIRIEHTTVDGNGNLRFGVYFPAAYYSPDDIVVRYCDIYGQQGPIHAVRGVTSEYNLLHDQHYEAETHNTAASHRGGHCTFRRNRVRPGSTGSSGVNWYAESSPYDNLHMVENLIDAPNAVVGCQFPDGDDPSILYSDLEPGMIRECRGNLIDTSFSNPELWSVFTDNVTGW